MSDGGGANAPASRIHAPRYPPLDLDPVPFVMSWHRRNDGHPAQRWLRETIASLFAPEP